MMTPAKWTLLLLGWPAWRTDGLPAQPASGLAARARYVTALVVGRNRAARRLERRISQERPKWPCPKPRRASNGDIGRAESVAGRNTCIPGGIAAQSAAIRGPRRVVPGRPSVRPSRPIPTGAGSTLRESSSPSPKPLLSPGLGSPRRARLDCGGRLKACRGPRPVKTGLRRAGLRVAGYEMAATTISRSLNGLAHAVHQSAYEVDLAN